ncbi:MAG: preprotein translocase subunit SecG [Clostridia bacterium]|nr:preprotein translocase subunit SecG [Clostridia bacterium]
MNWKLICTIIHIVVTVFLVVAVLLQNDKDAGLSGTIAGNGSDTFFGKNKNRTLNGFLEKLTAIMAFLFIVLSILLSVVFK